MKLEDIGAKAGVSRSTVSRVINNDPSVNAKTRERVWSVIRGEGYSPNFAARALVTRRTHVIGVMIPQTFSTVFQDPYYFPTLLQGISQTLNQHRYAMLLWIEDEANDLEAFYATIVRRHLMDGLIIASIPMRHPLIDQLVEMNMPLVMVERPDVSHAGIPHVTVDNRAAARHAVEHLIECLQARGRRRVATITGDLFNADGYDRLLGYQDALAAAGWPLDSDLIIEGSFTRTAGAAHLPTLVERGADAIFAGNDQIAFGILDAAPALGVRIPEDIALVGFDDLPLAERVGLTTVRQPVQERGARAARLLIDVLARRSAETDVTDALALKNGIDKADHAENAVLLPTELVIRRSSSGLTGDRYEQRLLSQAVEAVKGGDGRVVSVR